MTRGAAARCLLAAALALAACAVEPPPPPSLDLDARRALVTAESGLASIVVLDDAGLVLARRDGAWALELSVPHGAAPGAALTVVATARDGEHRLTGRVPDEGPLGVDLDVPAGQGAVPLGAEHPFTVVEGAHVRAAVVLRVRDPGPVVLTLGDERREIATTVPGERRVVYFDAPEGTAELRVEAAGVERRTTLRPRRLTRAEAREQLALVEVVFPSDSNGRPEPARPPGRVTLPAEWWRALLRATGVGYRAQDPHGPWAQQGVVLRNTGADPVNLVVESRVLGDDGAPAAPFRPRDRDRPGQTGLVAALVRVPAGAHVTAQLPFYVDADALPEGSSTWTRELAITPLGSSEPLWTAREPLQVKRGSSWVSVAFAVSLVGGLLGALLIALRLPVWLRMRTADLVTIAVFATLSFLVSGASAVVSAGVSAVLGPFAIFATNLVDDVLRYALLATLVTLLPRPGVVALSVLLSWLMRGVSFGSFSPLDVLYVGSQVLWIESALWAAGITRVPGWVDGAAWARFLRLGAGFGVASVLSSLTGLASAMVLYRLFYADWYVAAVLAGPGFLYVWIACALGVGFAGSLRRVEA